MMNGDKIILRNGGTNYCTVEQVEKYLLSLVNSNNIFSIDRKNKIIDTEYDFAQNIPNLDSPNTFDMNSIMAKSPDVFSHFIYQEFFIQFNKTRFNNTWDFYTDRGNVTPKLFQDIINEFLKLLISLEYIVKRNKKDIFLISFFATSYKCLHDCTKILQIICTKYFDLDLKTDFPINTYAWMKIYDFYINQIAFWINSILPTTCSYYYLALATIEEDCEPINMPILIEYKLVDKKLVRARDWDIEIDHIFSPEHIDLL